MKCFRDLNIFCLSSCLNSLGHKPVKSCLDYLILTKLRIVKCHISRVLNFVILKGDKDWSVLVFVTFFLFFDM